MCAKCECDKKEQWSISFDRKYLMGQSVKVWRAIQYDDFGVENDALTSLVHIYTSWLKGSRSERMLSDLGVIFPGYVFIIKFSICTNWFSSHGISSCFPHYLHRSVLKNAPSSLKERYIYFVRIYTLTINKRKWNLPTLKCSRCYACWLTFPQSSKNLCS